MDGMNILSNLGSSLTNPYNMCNGDSIFRKGLSPQAGQSPGGGFTLLQGHVQLMAMVPHLPENQISPRWKTSDDASESKCQTASEKEKHSSNVGHPITPRMMPSVTKCARPNLPSIMSDKSENRKNVNPNTNTRTLSKLSLPHPVTMPSFSKQFGGPQMPNAPFHPMSNQSNYHMNSPNQLPHSNSPFPPHIPQIPPANLNPGSFMNNQYNPTSPTWPQMAYQFMNNLLPNQQQQPSPHPFYGHKSNGGGLGGGDFHHNNMFQYPFQQPPIPFQPPQPVPTPCYESPYAYQLNSPRDMYFPQLHTQPNPFYAPPYAAQSVPCFGASCTVPPQPTFSMPNFPNQSPYVSYPGQPQAFNLPPETNELPTFHPSNSTSLPDISLSRSKERPKFSPSKVCNSLPSLRNRKKSHFNSNGHKREESILLENSSSDEEPAHYNPTTSSRIKLPPLSTKPKNVSRDEPSPTNFNNCGPESNPSKIKHNPRVMHTPVGVVVNPKREDSSKQQQQQQQKPVEDQEPEDESVCASGKCAHCKCCRNQMVWEEDRRKKKVPSQKFHTPRKKSEKNLVVAVHQCFPSDSSNSDAEDDDDMISSMRRIVPPHQCNSNRKETAGTVAVYQSTSPVRGGIPPVVIKKRKPTLDTILYKPRIKGETEEIFDVLHDLSPDEVKLYSCEYLTELLSSDDWSNCHIGLQTMVRMARHRPKMLLNYLGPILWFAFKHLTSAKSALCRAAIVTFKELFQRIGSALDNDLEKLTEKLVLKSLAPNRFIREECYRALEAMVNHCTLIKVLTALEIVGKKPQVRAATHRIARMIKQFVQVAGVDTCLKSMYAEKLLPMLFCFMTEANNETRTGAKEALAMLMNHLQFEKAVTKHVRFDRNSTEVFKKLDKMRGRNRYRGPIAATKAYHSIAQFKRRPTKMISYF